MGSQKKVKRIQICDEQAVRLLDYRSAKKSEVILE